jgi:hypothetical protein
MNILRRRHAVRKSPAIRLSSAVIILALAGVFGCVLMAKHVAASLMKTSAVSVESEIVVHASGRGKGFLNFKDGQRPRVEYDGASQATDPLRNGSAQPLSLATADFDLDGAPDLVTGYGNSGSGILTIQRGNLDAFAPKDLTIYDRAAKGLLPPSFLSTSSAIQIPERADFIFTDDVNADGYPDLIVAAREGGLYVLVNNGEGSFNAPEKIEPGGL